MARAVGDADKTVALTTETATGEFREALAEVEFEFEKAAAPLIASHTVAVADAERDYRMTIVETAIATGIRDQQEEIIRLRNLGINDPQVLYAQPIVLGSESWVAWFYHGVVDGEFFEQAVEIVVDYYSGVFDTLTFGGTKWLRDQVGLTHWVDTSSWAYMGGMVAGLGVQIAIAFFTGGTCSVGALVTAAKIYNAISVGVGLFHTYQNYQNGTLSWVDVLNVLPVAAWGIGKAGRILGKWACFVPGTEVVMGGTQGETVVTCSGPARLDWLWTALCAGAAMGVFVALDDRRRTNKKETSTLDVVFSGNNNVDNLPIWEEDLDEFSAVLAECDEFDANCEQAVSDVLFASETALADVAACAALDTPSPAKAIKKTAPRCERTMQNVATRQRTTPSIDQTPQHCHAVVPTNALSETSKQKRTSFRNILDNPNTKSFSGRILRSPRGVYATARRILVTRVCCETSTTNSSQANRRNPSR